MFQPSSPQYEHNRLSPQPMPGHAPTFTGLGYAEITPNDSASAIHDSDNHSTLSSQVNNNGNTFSFKFNYGNKIHRFRHDTTNFSGLLEIIQQKIMIEHLSISQSYVTIKSNNKEEEDNWLSVAYLDDENDQVLMTCDSDLVDSVQIARKSGLDRVRLFVHDAMAERLELMNSNSQEKMEEVPAGQPTTLGHLLANSTASMPEKVAPPVEDLSDIKEEEEEDEDVSEEEEEENVTKKRKSSTRSIANRDLAAEYNLPISQEMLLPAAITFLGVVILGVFTISKLTGSSNTRY